MVRFLYILFIAVAGFLGSAGGSSRILGGSDAGIQDFPFAGSIEWLDFGHICGAVILNADWALTDAWCTYQPEVADFTIRVGTSIASNNTAATNTGKLHNVTEWIFHPRANVTHRDYDFALIKVDPPFEFGDNVAAVALPDFNQETPDDGVGAVAGWGQKEVGDSGPVSQLQYANMTLASDLSCASMLGDDYNERILCARGANGDVALCWEDEGGPLVVDGTLFGISLWPEICADPLEMQIFGRVASVRDWIDVTIST